MQSNPLNLIKSATEPIDEEILKISTRACMEESGLAKMISADAASDWADLDRVESNIIAAVNKVYRLRAQAQQIVPLIEDITRWDAEVFLLEKLKIRHKVGMIVEWGSLLTAMSVGLAFHYEKVPSAADLEGMKLYLSMVAGLFSLAGVVLCFLRLVDIYSPADASLKKYESQSQKMGLGLKDEVEQQAPQIAKLLPSQVLKDQAHDLLGIVRETAEKVQALVPSKS